MTIRTAAVLLALTAIAGAQAPTPTPPKPKVIAMPKKAEPTPKPKPKTKPKPKPAEDPVAPALPPAETPKTPAPEAEKTTPAPEQPKRNRASETSLAAYMPKVKAALGKTWATSLQPRAAEFQPGNVTVKFKLDAEGKVTEFAVTENSSNPAFAKFCEDHVRGIQFEPPPVRALEDGVLEIPFTFWLY